jgi:MerR family transcriptional regulator, light-induced transcriptional regulator
VHESGNKTGHLRIGELSRRSGVSPELLRAWEERYALLTPTRTDGGFRLYDEEDEQRVRLMLQFLSGGVAAAEAARLALATRTAQSSPLASSQGSPIAADGALRHALDEFNDAAAHAALDSAFSAYGLEIALRDVVLPYLQELGERWEGGSASIAQEHFATALLRGRLLGLARGWGAGQGPRALLACVPGDYHDLALICFGLALRAHGWSITFLGPDTPTATIAESADQMQPRLVVVAASSPSQAAACRAGLAEVARIAPLALGGRGTSAAFADAIGARYLAGDPVTAAADVASATSW